MGPDCFQTNLQGIRFSDALQTRAFDPVSTCPLKDGLRYGLRTKTPDYDSDGCGNKLGCAVTCAREIVRTREPGPIFLQGRLKPAESDKSTKRPEVVHATNHIQDK